MTAKHPAIAIHPQKVVVEPWHGQHQVYGVFMLPISVRPGSDVLLTVQNVGIYCDAAVNNGTRVQNINAAPGHYLMIDHIRTRTALWLWAQGKLHQLQQPTNWTLVYHLPD